jgi:hypothetical protein
MRNRKAIITTAGTLACAVGIGFFMQSTASVPTPSPDYRGATLTNADAAVLDVEEIILTAADLVQDTSAAVPEEAVVLAAGQGDIAPVTDDVLANENIAQSDEQPVIQTAASMDVMQPPVPQTQAQIVPAPECQITANARPIAAAMVNLTLSASCLPGERVTVHHAGMLFNQITDASGSFNITVPALTKDAVFVVAFSDGEGAVAQTTVDEIVDFDRVALQWKGDTGFGLHALEFGADYGGTGHVWSGATRDMSYAVTGEGGYISRLGDSSVPDGLLAEVYTFPARTAQVSGDVALSVETEVASNNCGLEIEAQTLQTISGKDITSRDLTLSVPDCDAAGNFLVLNNLFEDLKVASN